MTETEEDKIIEAMKEIYELARSTNSHHKTYINEDLAREHDQRLNQILAIAEEYI